MGWVHSLNERVADSVVGRYFELKGRKTTFSTGWNRSEANIITLPPCWTHASWDCFNHSIVILLCLSMQSSGLELYAS